ncbi:hypothetical protein [Clostridium lundense]|uniref:hypothetical protein n=1 Tax=Clostridium lundense TaxID=319475 RepID=UPI00047FC2FE|nr:hypothetical protein [Clostridium lundense]
MKKLLSLWAFILVLIMYPTTAFAGENKKDSEDTKQTINLTINLQSLDETKESEEEQTKIRIRKSTSSKNLDLWDCYISKIKSGYIKGSSRTSSAVVADEIGCTIYFQMYDGSRWKTVGSKSYTNYNTDSIRKSCSIAVNSGKEYRVVVDHYAVFNGHKETVTSTSSSIYVD